MQLEEAIKRLEEHILSMIDAVKNHTMTDLIVGHIPMATAYNFRYTLERKPLNVTSSTLTKVAHRLDHLESCKTYSKELKQILNSFVNDYIFVDSINELTKNGLNYKTLKNMEDKSLKTSYRLSTMVKYARDIDVKRKEGAIVCKR